MRLIEWIYYWDGLSRVLDVLIVAFLIYKTLVFVKGTRALPMIAGLSLLLILYWASVQLSLVSLNWILGNFLGSAILVIVVLFQDDLRRGLTKVGLLPGFASESGGEQEKAVRAIARACQSLASKKRGAIIVICGDIGLDDYTEHAVRLDAEVSHQLLISLFVPQSPLHDGAVVIARNRISVAGAVLPLSFNPKISSVLGTRHRAALGLSERTDAICLVVSEERGTISVIREGKVYSGFGEDSLVAELLLLLRRRRVGRKEVNTLLKPKPLESGVTEDSSEEITEEHQVSAGAISTENSTSSTKGS